MLHRCFLAQVRFMSARCGRKCAGGFEKTGLRHHRANDVCHFHPLCILDFRLKRGEIVRSFRFKVSLVQRFRSITFMMRLQMIHGMCLENVYSTMLEEREVLGRLQVPPALNV